MCMTFLKYVNKSPVVPIQTHNVPNCAYAYLSARFFCSIRRFDVVYNFTNFILLH